MQLIFLVKISQIIINSLKENPVSKQLDFLLRKNPLISYFVSSFKSTIDSHNRNFDSHEVSHAYQN
jgi:hypothetical protein